LQEFALWEKRFLLGRQRPFYESQPLATIAARKASRAQNGNVTHHANMMHRNTPHRTSYVRIDALAPTMADVMVWVVLSGTANCDAPKIVNAAEVRAAKPCHM